MGRILRVSKDGKHIIAGQKGTHICIMETDPNGQTAKQMIIDNEGDEIYDHVAVGKDKFVTLRKSGEMKLFKFNTATKESDLLFSSMIKINALTDEYCNTLAISKDCKFIAIGVPVEDAGFHTAKILVYQVEEKSFGLKGELDLNSHLFGKCSSMTFVEDKKNKTSVVVLCDTNPDSGVKSQVLTLNFNRGSGFLTERGSLRKQIDVDNVLMLLSPGESTLIGIDAEGRFMEIKY